MARDKKPRSAIKDVVSREYTINLHKVNILSTFIIPYVNNSRRFEKVKIVAMRESNANLSQNILPSGIIPRDSGRN